MRTSLYILAFIIINTFLFSQAPGHLGKRFSIGYGFHTSPSVFNANGQNQTIIGRGGSAESGSPAFNAIHELNIEFATSSKWQTCFSARYYKTVYDNAESFNSSQISGYNIQSSRPEGYYDVRGLTYTLYFKYFGKRYVAPWGRYVMFGPTVNTVKTTYDPEVMNIVASRYVSKNNTSVYEDTTLAPFGPKEQNYVGVNLMMGIGRSRIYSNRIILDYGFNIHMFSVLSSLFDITGNRIGGSPITPANYIESTVKQRVRGVNRFNLFLKIGVLLF